MCYFSGHRLTDFDVHVYETNPVSLPQTVGVLCHHHSGPLTDGQVVNLTCGQPVLGQVVRVTNGALDNFSICEIEVFASEGNL